MATTKKRKKETLDDSILVRCTTKQKKDIKEMANRLNMPYTTYAHDKLFNGNERKKYTKNILGKTLVTTSKSLDDIYNLLAQTNSDSISIDALRPFLDDMRKEYDNLCRL